MIPANSYRLAKVWQNDSPSALAIAAKVMGDQAVAEDIVQQTFAELGELMERTPIRNAQAVLMTILRRRLIDAIRAKQGQPELVSLESLDSDPGLGTRGVYHDATFAPKFDSLVRRLPEAQREVFILTELRGLTVREVEEVTGLSKSSAHRLDAAARTRIRKELAA